MSEKELDSSVNKYKEEYKSNNLFKDNISLSLNNILEKNKKNK